MKNIVYISREKLQNALRKHDELLNENPFLKEELAEFRKLIQQEKLPRENTIATEITQEQPSSREEK